MRRLALPLLFLLGLLTAGALSASVVASTLTGTTMTTMTMSGTTGTMTTPTTTATTITTTPTPRPKRIAVGVTVGGINVGKLKRSTALRIVRAKVARPLVIRIDRTRLRVAYGRLGAVPQVRRAIERAMKVGPYTVVPLEVQLREWRVRAYVARLVPRFAVAPRDARLAGLRGLRPRILRERPGRQLDGKATTQVLEAALRANDHGPVRLETDPVAARVTRSDFGPIIVIRRGSNRLYLYKGGRFWRVFPVATGQAAYPTPLGHFSIAVMWRNPWWYPPNSSWARGAKPIPPGPGNPLGTRWMGLTAPGVGIHGTPDAASIGYSASHGCIRMHISSAEWLFAHVHIGTPVFIVRA